MVSVKMKNYFKNKIILITGGTGSFGSAFVNYLVQNNYSFKEIKIFSRDEKKQDDFRKKINNLLENKGTKTVDHFHKILGKIIWNKCGMSRNAKNLKEAISEIKKLREDFYNDVFVPGTNESFNESLAKALRVADFLELGELFAKDALTRTESCGGHFREESQTPEGEALRDDKNFTFVSAWEYCGCCV